MKCLIFGSDGMLGSYANLYLKKFYKVIPFTRKNFDISSSSKKDFFNYINKKIENVDLILNCAGIIKQRNVSDTEMIMVNSVFPHWLAELKNKLNCNIIHITTDCVYSGNKGKYSENDIHDCNDTYGKSKSIGENKNLTIIRTSIIGEEIKNKLSLLEWVKSNKNGRINGFENHYWNGVTCLELIKYIHDIINNNLFWSGVRNIFSPDTVSKYDLVSMISNVYDLNITIDKKNTFFCDRSLVSLYNTCPINKKILNQIQDLKNFNIRDNN